MFTFKAVEIAVKYIDSMQKSLGTCMEEEFKEHLAKGLDLTIDDE